MVSVLPLAIGSILDQTSGVHRSQLVQTGPASLLLRLDLEPGMPGGQAWDHACSNLTRFLAAHGLAGIDITRAAERPQTSATSGKFRRIIARAPGSRPMTELVTDGDLDARTAIQALTSPATQIGLVSEDRPRAVVATIRSGFHRAGGA